MAAVVSITKNESDCARCAAGPSPRPKLIVIDEGQVFAASVREIAEDLGHQVEILVRAGAVMRACRAEPPELVLIGHVSPEMEGLKLIAWLCRSSSVARLLVLTDGNRCYSHLSRQYTKPGKSPVVEARPRPLGAKALRSALARETPELS